MIPAAMLSSTSLILLDQREPRGPRHRGTDSKKVDVSNMLDLLKTYNSH